MSSLWKLLGFLLSMLSVRGPLKDKNQKTAQKYFQPVLGTLSTQKPAKIHNIKLLLLPLDQ